MNGHAHLVPTTAPPPFLLSRSTPRFLFHRLMLAPPPHTHTNSTEIFPFQLPATFASSHQPWNLPR